MTSISGIPPHLAYLDLNANRLLAMVNVSEHPNRQGFNAFRDTNPMHVDSQNEEGMSTPKGSLENLLESDAFSKMQLSTPTKAAKTEDSQVSPPAVNRYFSANSHSSMSSPGSESHSINGESRADSGLSSRSSTTIDRCSTNFLKMNTVFRKYASEEQRTIMRQEDQLAIMEESVKNGIFESDEEQRVAGSRRSFIDREQSLSNSARTNRARYTTD